MRDDIQQIKRSYWTTLLPWARGKPIASDETDRSNGVPRRQHSIQAAYSSPLIQHSIGQHSYFLDGGVAQGVECWTCDPQIMASNPTRDNAA